MDEITRKELKKFDRELMQRLRSADPDQLRKLATTPIKGSREIFKQKER